MRSILTCVAAALAPAIFAHGTAQERHPPGTAAPPLRLDAVVTNDTGHAIVGLRASDFEVREDGATRPISLAEFRKVPRNSPVEVRPIDTRADEEREVREPGTRVFAFFLDEFHVAAGASADRAREAVSIFVDDKVYARDLVAVVRPLDSPASIRFTRDRGLLHGSIAAFSGRKGNYSPRTALEERRIGRDPAAAVAARQRVVVEGLRDLAVRLGELKADRAVVVLVSEGFPRHTPDAGSVPVLESVVHASSRSHFSIYTFNPATAGAEDDPRRDAELSTLRWLAAETGGVLIAPDTFIAGFSRMFHDTEAYYALSYEPAHADGRFRRLEVRTRRGAHVRTHAGYWAAASAADSPLGPTREGAGDAPRRPLRRSMVIDAWSGIRRSATGDARMTVTWEPRSGAPTSPRTVSVKARTLAGTTLFDAPIGPVRGASPTGRDSARFDVPPGRVEIDMTVFDADGTVVDTEARDVDVPDVRSSGPGFVWLSVEIVRARTLRELHQAGGDHDATPSAARTFDRGHQLLIRVPAFDPTGAAVRVAARVLGRMGQPIRDLTAAQQETPGGVAEFSLPIAGLPAGPYYLDVSGTSINGTAAERLAFQVR